MLITMRTISDTLKEAVLKSGLPHRQIGLRAGVNRISIMRFMRGDTSITLDQAERLAEFFGLSLMPKDTTKRQRKEG